MAAFMIVGGKLGDILGRRRAFRIGHLIYGVGTLLTAVAWSVPVLTLGWSVLEGIGAALVLTSNLTWRPVFAGTVGAVLFALGLGAIVFGVLKASSWGWLTPRDSPITPFGFSLTPFLIALGAGFLVPFTHWQRRREAEDRQPLVHLRLLKAPPLRAGLTMFAFQNLILMGIFFAIPLYLQIVQGYDAFETGVRMLPVSVTLFGTALLGSRLAGRFSPRSLVRTGVMDVPEGAVL
jgi:MFS family permease